MAKQPKPSQRQMDRAMKIVRAGPSDGWASLSDSITLLIEKGEATNDALIEALTARQDLPRKPTSEDFDVLEQSIADVEEAAMDAADEAASIRKRVKDYLTIVESARRIARRREEG
jgi:hypothetical protein